MSIFYSLKLLLFYTACTTFLLSTFLFTPLATTVNSCIVQTYADVTTSEFTLRKAAETVVMPIFPSMALRTKKKVSGVAIVEVYINVGGEVTHVKVIECANKDIAQSIIQAVQQWRFGPFRTDKHEAVTVKGKLTFYFQADKFKGRITNPIQFAGKGSG